MISLIFIIFLWLVCYNVIFKSTQIKSKEIISVKIFYSISIVRTMRKSDSMARGRGVNSTWPANNSTYSSQCLNKVKIIHWKQNKCKTMLTNHMMWFRTLAPTHHSLTLQRVTLVKKSLIKSITIRTYKKTSMTTNKLS